MDVEPWVGNLLPKGSQNANHLLARTNKSNHVCLKKMEQSKHAKTYLSVQEVDLFLRSISGRHEARDRALLLLMFRHGLHVSEVCSLRMSDVDLKARRILVRRNHGYPDVVTRHSLLEDEVDALTKWLKVRDNMGSKCDDVFISANRTQLSRKTVWLLMKRHGEKADLRLSIYPEVLRESHYAAEARHLKTSVRSFSPSGREDAYVS